MSYDPQNAPDWHPESICYKCGATVKDDDGVWIDSTQGDGCDPGVHDGAPFTFLREYLGGREVIDLVSDYEYFTIDVIQDTEAADELVQRIRAEVEVITNAEQDGGVYIERYTVITPELAEIVRG